MGSLSEPIYRGDHGPDLRVNAGCQVGHFGQGIAKGGKAPWVFPVRKHGCQKGGQVGGPYGDGKGCVQSDRPYAALVAAVHEVAADGKAVVSLDVFQQCGGFAIGGGAICLGHQSDDADLAQHSAQHIESSRPICVVVKEIAGFNLVHFQQVGPDVDCVAVQLPACAVDAVKSVGSDPVGANVDGGQHIAGRSQQGSDVARSPLVVGIGVIDENDSLRRHKGGSRNKPGRGLSRLPLAADLLAGRAGIGLRGPLIIRRGQVCAAAARPEKPSEQSHVLIPFDNAGPAYRAAGIVQTKEAA